MAAPAKLTAEQWIVVETRYMAGVESVLSIAKEYGISSQAINDRVRRRGLVRDMASAKRERVKMKLASNQASTDKLQPVVDKLLDEQSDIDAAVLREAARAQAKIVALQNQTIDRYVKATAERDAVEAGERDGDAKDVIVLGEWKDVAHTLRIASESYMKLRGLEDKPAATDGFDDWARREGIIK